MTPIYMRIAQMLEDLILDGSLKEDERVYSQYQLAEMFNINPATAAKGLNLLADEGTVYKKRGLGMFVSADARERILKKRRDGAFKEMARQLVLEAKRLQIDKEKLIDEIRHIYESGAGE
jgi:GntR family transcriptional regulator